MNPDNSCIARRRIPLAGTHNTRDLGGYPCPSGATRFGVFLRSDSPHALTEKDIATLRQCGIRHSLDLRAPGECAAKPSRLASAQGITSHHVCLSDKMDSEDYEGDLPGSMAGLYISLLDNAMAELGEVVRLLATCQGGCLFHCAVGKDRTGVVAMLLLSLAGVDEADIVADYSVSEIYMREVFARFMQEAKENNLPEATHEYRIGSLPKSMWRVITHLHSVYGGAEQYLLKAGLTTKDFALLHQKFVAE